MCSSSALSPRPLHRGDRHGAREDARRREGAPQHRGLASIRREIFVRRPYPCRAPERFDVDGPRPHPDGSPAVVLPSRDLARTARMMERRRYSFWRSALRHRDGPPLRVDEALATLLAGNASTRRSRRWISKKLVSRTVVCAGTISRSRGWRERTCSPPPHRTLLPTWRTLSASPCRQRQLGMCRTLPPTTPVPRAAAPRRRRLRPACSEVTDERPGCPSGRLA